MNKAVQGFLADEGRALRVLSNGAMTALVLGLAVAIGAIVLMH
jgi:hypothetical protein